MYLYYLLLSIKNKNTITIITTNITNIIFLEKKSNVFVSIISGIDYALSVVIDVVTTGIPVNSILVSKCSSTFILLIKVPSAE